MLPRTVAVSPLARRILARLVLAAGAATLVALFLREGGSGDRHLTVTIDPRPLGDAVRALHVDVAEGERTLGATERAFAPGEALSPVSVTTAAARGTIEVRVELDTSAGPRRVRRTVAAAGARTVTVSIDGLEPVADATR